MLILMVWIEFPMEGGDNTACHGLHVGSLALLDEVAPLSLFGRGECVRLNTGSRAREHPVRLFVNPVTIRLDMPLDFRLTKDGDAHPSINPFCGSYHAER